MEEIVQLINTTGFPIIVSIIMFKLLVAEKDARRSENEAFIKSIDNNTIALERLVEQLDKQEGGYKIGTDN